MSGSGEWLETRKRIFVWAPRPRSSRSSSTCRTRSTCTSPPRAQRLVRADAARGRLEPLDFEVEDEAAAARLKDARRHDVEADARHSCTECRRCQDVCPAWATEGALPEAPRHGPPRPALRGGARPSSAGGRRRRSCRRGDRRRRLGLRHLRRLRARVPGLDQHVDHIVDLRRHLVMVESRFPAEAGTMLRDVGRSSNRGGSPRASGPRGPTASTCGSSSRATRREILYWVGCAASFDERARATARATASLLLRAGLDVAILGPRESCTGDPARRMGDEYVPGAGAAERRDTGRGGRHARRHELPPLLQHARARVRGLRRPLRGRPPHRAARHAPARRPARGARGHGGDHVPRLVLPRAPQRRRRASRDRLADRQAARDGAERQGDVAAAAPAAHMWMEERGRAINEERVREAAATGAAAWPSPARSAR